MIRKDFIEAEIQKLAEVIAKIIGLKNQGDLDNALELSRQTLSETFGFEKEFLENSTIEEFQTEVTRRNYSAEKLNLFAQLLFESAYPFQDTDECKSIVHKVAFLLNMLETEHHQQTLENLNRREMIDNFLNNNQYE